MSRLNLTLDDDTLGRLTRRARAERAPTASLARLLLREALDRRDALEHARRMARDYAAGREDARELLDDWEHLGLEVLGPEDA